MAAGELLSHSMLSRWMQTLGPYTVVGTLGEGGMATVYLAEDPRHGRQVAIKVMKPDTSLHIGPERFMREIETVARLTHPHILPLYDSGAAGDQLYYVMPHILGGSLRGKLDREGRLPVEEAVAIAQGIAAGLWYAHQRGLVHRDIKPANVLLSDGIPLVADFGIARSTAVVAESTAETKTITPQITRANVILGTPQYMAPEQAFGETAPDPRIDIYALGCVLFEMLAGHPPYVAATMPAMLMRHAMDPIPSLQAIRADVPAAVAAIAERALAKSPLDRFESAQEFSRALATALATGDSGVGRAGKGDVRIAVLPFESLGGTAEDQALGDGICDELIHTLGRIQGVRVTARGSSFLFRERRADVREIAAQLNVTQVLDGTMRRLGNRMRLTVQLINASDGFQTWSERYDREVDDVFALQEEIAGAIAGVLREKLTGSAGQAAASFDAYAHYLTGLQHWNKRTPNDLDKALAELKLAADMDPSFAPAWGAMGLCYVTLHLYGLRAPSDVIPLARTAVDRALRLDRHQAGALTARACIRAVHDWDMVAAERDFREVIAAAPSDALAQQWYAVNLLAPLGRYDEARAALARARELDPLSPAVAVSEGFVHYLSGNLTAGIAACDAALSLDPQFMAAYYFQGPILAAARQPDAAVDALEMAAEGMGRSPEVLAALGVVCADAGDIVRARELVAELVAAWESRYVSPALTAMIRLALGQTEEAMRDLERAIDVRAVEAIWLEVRPAFARLRADNRLAALIQRRNAARKLAAATGILPN
jgi:TolB-like protein/Flp pilus assembly protein TadD